MRTFFALLRREWAGFFTSPVGYVFLVVFLLLAGFTTFFLGGILVRGQADLAVFFLWVPWLFLVLVPAVAMRSWAEERRSGTIELLFTWPVRTVVAVLAKFFAAWAVLAMALALTFPLVITVNFLGSPDNGAILTGYLGCLLLGGGFLSVGQLTSSLTKNQVIAFVTGVAACLLLLTIGWPPTTSFLEKFLPDPVVYGVAGIGVLSHFHSIQRGVLDSRDLIYFLSLIILGLGATRVVLELGRGWRRLVLAGTAVAVVLAVVGANVLASLVWGRFDLTERREFSLSSGTRQILRSLDEKVQVRLYVATSTGRIPPLLEAYVQRIEDLLGEMRAASNGMLEVERLHPLPDTVAEDSARLDGIEAQQLGEGQALVLGLSATRLDKKVALPFLPPSRERLLEYDIIRTIVQVNTRKPSVVGVLSPLNVFGAGQSTPDRPSTNPWVAIRELERDYDVRPLPFTTESIDEAIETLVVIHPVGIQKSTERAIAQFLRRGGRLMACVDPYALLESVGEKDISRSNLPNLFGAWGISFDDQLVVADLGSMSQTPEGRAPGILALGESSMNPDDVLTSRIVDVYLAYTGTFAGSPTESLTVTDLIRSSPDSRLAPPVEARFEAERLIRDFVPSGNEYPLAIRIDGVFPHWESETADSPRPQPTTVIAIADTDFMQDAMAVSEVRGIYQGPRRVIPVNGNLSLFQSAVDLLAGDPRLISVRSRATTSRPFHVIRDIQNRAERKYADNVRQLQHQLEETQKRLEQLENATESPSASQLTALQQQEIQHFQQQQVRLNAELRQTRRQIRAEIDHLEASLKAWNIAGPPVLVIIVGLTIAAIRRRRQKLVTR